MTKKEQVFEIVEAQIIRDVYNVKATSYEEALRLHMKKKSQYIETGERVGFSTEGGLSFDELPECISDEFLEHVRSNWNEDRNREYIEGILHVGKKN